MDPFYWILLRIDLLNRVPIIYLPYLVGMYRLSKIWYVPTIPTCILHILMYLNKTNAYILIQRNSLLSKYVLRRHWKFHWSRPIFFPWRTSLSQGGRSESPAYDERSSLLRTFKQGRKRRKEREGEEEEENKLELRHQTALVTRNFTTLRQQQVGTGSEGS